MLYILIFKNVYTQNLTNHNIQLLHAHNPLPLDETSKSVMKIVIAMGIATAVVLLAIPLEDTQMRIISIVTI